MVQPAWAAAGTTPPLAGSVSGPAPGSATAPGAGSAAVPSDGKRRWSAADLAAALGNPPPTDEQRMVIEAPPRPLLVVAGAGSGKTETMASRVVWLVANGVVDPDQVLGLTFTRKAATELAERIGRRLRRLRREGLWTPAPEADGAEVLGGTPTVSTYHSYAGRIVGEHALRIGVEPQSRLLTEAAAWQIAAEAVERFDGPLELLRTPSSPSGPAFSTMVGAVVDLAGEMAEHLLEPEQVEELLDAVEQRLGSLPTGAVKTSGAVRDLRAVLLARSSILPLVRAFSQLKRSRDSLDFADQMALAARLAARFPDVGEMERQRFRAVLLDEFQDTSEAQLVLLSELFATGAEDMCVTAVGDPNQSIYGWRGASATTLSRFPHLFHGAGAAASVLPLSTSWRNDRAILAVANTTSGPLRHRVGSGVQRLRARPDAAAGRVLAARLLTVEDEAAHVAEWVDRHWRRAAMTREVDTGDRPLTAAVLCRKRSQFPAVVEALKQRGLPVEVVGLGGLLTTPEIIDIVSLLHVVQDPTRGDHLMRLLTGPLVRLAPADLDGLGAWARALTGRGARTSPSASATAEHVVSDLAPDSADQVGIVEALDALPPPTWAGREGQRISALGLQRLAGLRGVIGRLRELTALPLADLVGAAERALGLDIEVLARPEYDPATARAHLDAFADVAGTFSTSAERPTLGGFLSWLAAAQEQERGLDKGYIEVSDAAVQVLTVHAAKGLEWDVVAVPGLVEASFPALQSGVSSWKEGRWNAPTPADRGWSSGLAGVPYDLRGDRDGLPHLPWRTVSDLAALDTALRSFVAAGGEHGVAEERRLAYVAFTRARREMLLTAPIWADATTPRVTSRFLTDLVEPPGGPVQPAEPVGALVEVSHWEPMPEPVDGDVKGVCNPRTAEPQSMPWPSDPMARRRLELADAVAAVHAAWDNAAPEPAGAPSVLEGPADREITLLLAERAAAEAVTRDGVTEVLVPRHLSASNVVSLAADPEGFATDLRRPIPSAPALAARRGTAFHAWVEQHFARAAFLDVLELPGSADDDPGDDGDLPAMKALFLASEWAERSPEAVELAVETVVDGIAVRGRIDAVFGRPGGGFTVVDWKTGATPTGRQARARAVQLGAYRLAFARLRRLPLTQVDAAFYYAATGETVWPPLPEEGDLRRVLAQVGA